MKRSPLKRTSSLKRTRRIRESEKARQRRMTHTERMNELRPVVFARDSWRCQARSSVCTGDAHQAHHRKMRSRGGADTLDNLVSVCMSCHRYLHEHPKWAAERGLLTPGWAA